MHGPRGSRRKQSDYAIAAHSLSASQTGATSEQIAAAKGHYDSGPLTVAQKLGLRCADKLHRSAREVDDGLAHQAAVKEFLALYTRLTGLPLELLTERDVLALANEISHSKLKIRPNCAARTTIEDIDPILDIAQNRSCQSEHHGNDNKLFHGWGFGLS